MNKTNKIAKTCLCSRTMIFFIVLCIVSFVQTFAFFQLTGISSALFRTKVISAIFSTIVIYLPFLFIGRKWRITVWIPIVAYTLFMITNVWYYRQFHAFYTGSALCAGAIFNSFVIEGTIALIRQSDLFLIVPPILLIPLYVHLHLDTENSQYGNKMRFALLLIWIICIPAQSALAFRRHSIYVDKVENSNENPMSRLALFYNTYVANPIDVTYLSHNIGLPYALFYMISDIYPDKVGLTESDYVDIKEMLSDVNPNPISGNKGKNLIFVIAESLNSEVLRLSREYGITPTLHHLMKDTSIVALNVVPQVGPGGSSDGQFICNTGLYPIFNQPLVSHYASADYPSIAKSLGYSNSLEFISEGKNIWNHYLTTISYGYTEIYDLIKDRPIVGDESARFECEEKGEDGHLFNYASAIIEHTRNPFYAFVTAISMHTPYDKPSVTPTLDTTHPFFKSMSNHKRNYLEAAHHFDTALGELINRLDEAGVLDNTVIAIVSDHNVPTQYFDGEMQDPFIPMIIYNAGVKLDYTGVIGQVDVFPTLLDVMGIESYILSQTGAEYRGLGHSILSDNPPTCAIGGDGVILPTGVVDSTLINRVEMSSLIIQSRFFE